MKLEFKEFMSVPIVMLILTCGVFYTINLGFVIQHENVHKAINSNYGIDSEIYINYFTLSGNTISYDADKCNDECKSLHSMNEIVSYNLDTVMFTIFSVGFMLLTLLILIYMELVFSNKIMMELKNG